MPIAPMVEEVVSSGLWSLNLHYGKGDDARDEMRAMSDLIRSSSQPIAALPELVEVLRSTLDHMEWSTEQGRNAYERARALLARLEGGV